MTGILEVVSGALILTGGISCIIGGIGLLRLPDFFSRTHAGGVTDTFGAPCILVGLVFQTADPLVSVKLLLILVFLFFTSPTAGYALARAALTHGQTPQVDDDSFDDSLREGAIPTNTGTAGKEAGPSD